MKKPAAKKAAVFLDRDGVLNEDSSYVYRLEDLKVLPGVPEALAKLKQAGLTLIAVTNQSGVARGMFSLEDVKRFNEELGKQTGNLIDAFYVCPHHPEGRIKEYATTCFCRKPGTDLIKRASTEHNLDLSQSYLVGDKQSDVDCGINAGLTTVLISGRYETGGAKPDFHAKNLKEGAELILGHRNRISQDS
jgi:D-glycero-D-manno-heptose 1,7-bisphosphate phosphatase